MGGFFGSAWRFIPHSVAPENRMYIEPFVLSKRIYLYGNRGGLTLL